MLVILFISVFEYTYFLKSIFEFLPHSLPWPYFHIYILWSLQVFGAITGDFSLVFGSRVEKLVNKFLALLPGICTIHFLSLEVNILKNG